MSKETVQPDEEEVKVEKPLVNFLFHAKWKLDMIRLMIEKPISVHKLVSLLPVEHRTVHRTVEYFRTQGFQIERIKRGGQTPFYHVTGFPSDFSQLITDLFFLIHKAEQRTNESISN